MKTLSKLIDDGLKVGTLVKSRIIESYYGDEVGDESNAVWQWDGICLNCILTDNNLFGIGDQIRLGYKPDIFQLTTAHDSNIDPKTLPIPEPFWTGWIASLSINPVPIQAETTELFYIDTDGSSVYKSDCQPCLPPS